MTAKEQAQMMAELYLEKNGYKIINDSRVFDIVAKDGETIVFFNLTYSENGEMQELEEMTKERRNEKEKAMISYFSKNKNDSGYARFDEMHVSLFDFGRAMIRHNKNALA